MFESPSLIQALVTNYQNHESGRDEEPWDEFRATYWSPKYGRCAADPRMTMIQWIRAWQALAEWSDEPKLRQALEERKPASAIANLGLGVVRAAAARPAAAGKIGRDLQSGLIPAFRPAALNQGQVQIDGGFHPVGASHAWHGVNQVVSLADNFHMALRDPTLRAADKDSTPPMAVQKVGRNQPCPCGSGKKYKRCHGAR